VTHPDIIRYFMTIPEASQLVLQAGSMGKGGEIFLLDMGEPVKIADLAREIIRLSGLEPDKDIKIVFTGLRPGEKLFEELLISGEGVKPTHHKKILIADARPMNLDVVQRYLAELAFCVRRGDAELAVQKLRELVPEFRPEERHSETPVHVHPAALTPAAEPV
jgi:FlaA1/EpsC-like NDP-sugar epimerase